MISIVLENVPYEQDIRELLMAFYPGETFNHELCAQAKLTLIGKLCGEIYEFNITEVGDDKKEAWSESVCVAVSESRFSTKNLLKPAIYTIFAKHTQTELPWGTLTGIRPTKIVMDELYKDIDIDTIAKNMRRTYLSSKAKTDLCIETALREKSILDKMDYVNGWSLYIGIPFCPTTCLYCSFTSYAISLWKGKTKLYIDALCKELKSVATMMKGRTLQTIYMGGGTPTSLEAKELDIILSCVEETFDLSSLMEFTVEAGRPDSITADKLSVLKNHNISRISINPQTMVQKTLDIIGRRHTVEDVCEKFEMARNMGFDNINMDLIVGLPEETIEDVKYTMERIQKLGPDSITVHSLAIKRAARLNTHKEDYEQLSCTSSWAMIDLTAERCKNMGLKPYYLYRQKNMAGNFENVGYSKPGMECIYNILIMEERQTIVACGAGTSSKIVFPEENRIERVENVKDPILYIERLDEMIERKEKMLAKS